MDRELVLQLLRGIVPGTLAGAVLLLVTFWRSRPHAEPGSTSPRVVVAIMALAAILLACFAIAFPLRTPSGLFEWLGWLPVAIVPVGLAIALVPSSSALRIVPLILGVFGLLVGLLFAPAAGWSGGEFKSISLAIVLALSLAALAHPLWSTRPLLSLAVAITAAAGMSQVLVLGFHALKLGQVAGIGASVLGGMAVAALILRLRRQPLPSLLPLIAVPALLACAATAQAPAVTETRLDWVLILLLASVPYAATGGLWIMQRKGAVAQWLVTLAIAGGPIVCAMGLILATRSESTSGY